MTKKDEEKESEEEEQEDADSDADEGVQPTADEIVEQLNTANERITALEKELAKKEISGRAEAGKQVETKEETPKEYNDRIEKEIGEGKHGD